MPPIPPELSESVVEDETFAAPRRERLPHSQFNTYGGEALMPIAMC